MKKIAIIGILHILAFVTVKAQPGFFIDFESLPSAERVLTIDTISYPNNCWQIGTPNKEFLSDANSPTNVIITDTVTPYPVNDTSSFTIWHTAHEGFVEGHTATLSGFYKIDTDTIGDFGVLEFSPDNGNLWVNLLTDTIYPPHWYSEKPVFYGQKDWTFFYVELAHMGFRYEFGDTVLFKFTFISDSVDNHKDGLMFDDIGFDDFTEGISLASFEEFDSNVFPNPGNQIITISFANTLLSNVDLDIMDGLGRLVYSKSDLNMGMISVDISDYAPGIYYYKLLNENEKKGSWGKFLVE